MRVALVSSYTPSLVRFRGPLISAITAAGHALFALGPEDDDDVARELAARGASFHRFPLGRTGLNPARDAASMRWLYRFFRRAKIDVVLSYTHKPVVYGSLAAHSAGVKRIFSMVTGFGSSFLGANLKARIAGAVARPMLKSAFAVNDRVFAFNQDIVEQFTAWGLFRDRAQVIRVNGTGIDLSRFSRAPLSSDGPVRFLLVARLLRDKGIREYAMAAASLRARGCDATFRLVGPYDVNASALSPQEVEGWARRGVLDYDGPSDDVRGLMRACSVYVLPSYAEGIPRTVLEAMATGRAIITTDAPGCRDCVDDGVNGFLVPPKDAPALARAMGRFVEDRGLLLSMGRASRARAERDYDIHRINRQLIDAMGLS